MKIYTMKSTYDHVESIREKWIEGKALPFETVLSSYTVAKKIEPLDYRERIFTPQLTLFGLLSQVMGSDQSCQQAVAQVIAHQAQCGVRLASANTAAYCKARARLPESILSELTQESAQALEQEADASWLWRKRHIKLVDGTSVSMPDTAFNQECYPQPDTQKKALVFHSRV